MSHLLGAIIPIMWMAGAVVLMVIFSTAKTLYREIKRYYESAIVNFDFVYILYLLYLEHYYGLKN